MQSGRWSCREANAHTGLASSRRTVCAPRRRCLILSFRGRTQNINTLLLVSVIASWLAILFLAFLLLGVLRSLEVLKWQLQQVQATNPTRMGRGGLKPGKKAPAFTLPTVRGEALSLAGYAGRQLFL